MSRRPQAAPGGHAEAPKKPCEALHKPQRKLNRPRMDPLGSPKRPPQTPREIMFPEGLPGTWSTGSRFLFISIRIFKYSGGALLVGDVVAGVVAPQEASKLLPRSLREAYNELPANTPQASELQPRHTGGMGRMPQAAPWEVPRGVPRHPAESCSQKAFREHGFPRRPAKSCSRQAFGNMVVLLSQEAPQEGARSISTGPDETPWEAPRGPPRHTAKSCSQTGFREHGFPQAPREIVFPERLLGTWFPSLHKRLPKRALGAGFS